MFSVKAGIARAFKAPNLYQSSAGYLLYSRGNGCPFGVDYNNGGGCYLAGNDNLDPEISVNKEIGLEFKHSGWRAGVTYFRNDYKNKIVSGTEVLNPGQRPAVLRWENGGKALVEGLEANLLVPVIEDSLDWSTNATYMIESKNKDTGNPLSIIPKYTINTMLDWQATDRFSANINWTMYGKQKPRQYATNWSETPVSNGGGLSSREVGSYSVFGAGVNYQLNKNLRVNAGISNLLNKTLYRAAEGASTYNEPGRAYYAGVTTSF